MLAPGLLLGACSGGPGLEAVSTSALPPKPGAGDAPQAPLQSESPKGQVKAALLLPLGGSIQLSLVAKGLQQAAELAIFERNVSNLQLVVKDDKGTAEGAAAAVQSAIAEGCEIILGPLLSTSVAAVAPIARKAQVPVIAFSNDMANGGQGVHLLSFFVSAEVARAVGYATAQGRRSFAALIPEDALGKDTEAAFRQAVEAGGGRVAILEHYPADLSGMVEPSKRVMEAVKGSGDSGGIDALFLPSAGDNVPRLAAMIRYHELDPTKVKLILTGGWDNPAAQREPRLAGAWLAGTDQGGWREMSARFAKTYNAMPPRLASLTYDAVMVASSFAGEGKGQRFTAQNLARESGFAGIDGQFRLTTAGGPVERSLAVFEMQSQGLVGVDPASGFTRALPGGSIGPIGATAVVRG
ncbi:MAG: penicillin-binding protein activator [Proteobacteria bacterium]|nr:penicillin-binding protein activator [Pseudomonadota bacterium]